MASRLDLVVDWRVEAAACGYRVQQIADKLCVSEQTLRRFFLTRFGKSPKECMAEWLKEEIERRLKNGEEVADVAAEFQMQPGNLRQFIRAQSPPTET